MRTTLNIDDEKIKELMKFTSAPNMSKAVQIAISEYIDMKRKKQLLAMRGKLDIADNWQELRSQELPELPNE